MFTKAKPPTLLQRRVKEIGQRLPSVVTVKKTARSAKRHGTWQQCWLKGSMGFQISCILIDYSTSGARLRFRSHQNIPKRVTLFCPALGIKQNARRVWVQNGDMGLEFI